VCWGPAFHNSAAGWAGRAAVVLFVENYLRHINFNDCVILRLCDVC
jgi:hypothetical protein